MLMAYLTFFTGIAISIIAIYYSVMGLTAIFAAAVIPIIIMGTVLEIAKLVTTIWLKQNWSRAPGLIKTYLSISVIVLMLITSMGIFGFLSKAHLDQGVPTSDVAAKVSLLDEKIKTERDNIEAAKKALQQMDAAVDQIMARSTNEAGAGRAVQLRRTQAKERNSLQSDITKSQQTISKLNEERAPIAAELRKVEAEVGPIKYIAALIYGEAPDANLLEKAVTWVIITIIFVFDPLAVLLLLASQYSFTWAREHRNLKIENDSVVNSDPLDKNTLDQPTPIDSPSTDTDSRIEPVINLSQEPVVEVDDQLDVTEDAPIETDQVKAAKRKWKEDNPGGSLHVEERKKQLGLIDKLPWEEAQYIQNSEQSASSLWQRLSNRQK